MLSRVANCLFWLGRYVERAENYARFIDVNYNLSLDLPPGFPEQWQPLIAATGDKDLYVSLHGEDFSKEQAVFFLSFQDENPNSILSVVSKARENARIVRENIPRETWEALNELHHFLKNECDRKVWELDNPITSFNYIKSKIQQLNGIAFGSIPRYQGWYFTKMGQYLERADKTSRILDVKYHILLPSLEEVGSPLDYLQWNALLKSVSGYNSFRQLYQGITPQNIISYLMLNRYFPRSVLFCLVGVEDCLHEISSSKRGFSNKAEKTTGAFRSKLEFADVHDIFQIGLHEYLDDLQLQLNHISAAVHDQFFKLRPNFSGQSQVQS